MQEQGTGLRVFKFGGASVKDAAAILNLCAIVKRESERGPLLVVVSAMGKTTNALEESFNALSVPPNGKDWGKYEPKLIKARLFHSAIIREIEAQILPEKTRRLGPAEAIVTYHLENGIPQPLNASQGGYDEGYDRFVSRGERLSAELVQRALLTQFEWEETAHLSAPLVIRTDTTWREANVNWAETERLINKKVPALLAAGARIIVTEGFVGGTDDRRTTTLGREGSDYSAAIFAYCLKAESVTIWKDVPGLLNADPKVFTDTVLYSEISYAETIEMAFYGASVIHPKTVKPLAERRIPLYVKSFLDPAAPGTVIHDCQHPPLAPAFIRKTGQCLISFESKDFAFISEENLGAIFGALAQARLKINLMQNSALSFSVCTDYSERRLGILLELLRGQFRMHYNSDLVLFTIKNYDAGSIEEVITGRKLLLEQRTRGTFQFVCE